MLDKEWYTARERCRYIHSAYTAPLLDSDSPNLWASYNTHCDRCEKLAPNYFDFKNELMESFVHLLTMFDHKLVFWPPFLFLKIISGGQHAMQFQQWALDNTAAKIVVRKDLGTFNIVILIM